MRFYSHSLDFLPALHITFLLSKIKYIIIILHLYFINYGDITMKKSLFFYNTIYQEILKSSVNHNMSNITWVPTNTVSDAIDYIKKNIYFFTSDNVRIYLMISSLNTKTTIRQILSVLNIKSSQILDIYQLYMHKLPTLHYERIIGNCTQPLDGIIFGISHGQTGIVEESLPGNVLNFCSSSQDIYFNTKILSALAEEYYDFICNAKYVIFDMFDYTYFNYDVLLSNELLNYLGFNGFFCENRNSNNKKIFRQNKILDDYSISTYMLPNSLVFSSIQRHIFEPTIQFQVANLDHFCRLLFRLNPDIQIIGVLLPKYYIVEENEKIVNQIWKPHFENIISSFQQKYTNFSFFDFKNLTSISKKQEYYRDLSHLNCNGAHHMTEIISSLISI